jgi:acetyl esterase/lipase
VSLHFVASSRPDFAAPIYPAPPPEAPIPANAPPLFLLCAADDEMASGVSTRYYSAWRAAGHPVELHIYSKGGHGFGINKQGHPRMAGSSASPNGSKPRVSFSKRNKTRKKTIS